MYGVASFLHSWRLLYVVRNYKGRKTTTKARSILTAYLFIFAACKGASAWEQRGPTHLLACVPTCLSKTTHPPITRELMGWSSVTDTLFILAAPVSLASALLLDET